MASVAIAPTLFEEVGGQAAIDRIVGRLVERILADPWLSLLFLAIDIEELKAAQSTFFSAAFGGGNERPSPVLVKADWEQFVRVILHFQATLEDLEIPNRLAGELVHAAIVAVFA